MWKFYNYGMTEFVAEDLDCFLKANDITAREFMLNDVNRRRRFLQHNVIANGQPQMVKFARISPDAQTCVDERGIKESEKS